MNGAQFILQAFRQHQIDTVFGYPGGCIMPLYDALVDAPEVQHVLCRHEQGCALAADGYARASGRLGVCIATSGPGATNLVTGVANAQRDSIPLLVITGQVPRALIGTDAFQETDVLGMSLGLVKHSYLVTDPQSLPAIMHEAIELAQSGRPGPVWVDLPKDVLLAELADVAPRPSAPAPPSSPPDLSDALNLLRAARKPLIYSGGGVRLGRAERTFRRFAEAAALPSVASLHGLGNHGRDDAQHLGMLGMHGSRAANQAVQQADLLLVVGARLDDRATGALSGFAPHAKLVHMDTDAAEFNKLRRAEVCLNGDLNALLQALTQALLEQPLRVDEWRKQCRQWHASGGFSVVSQTVPEAPIRGPQFIRTLSRRADPHSCITCDVGQHQMWVAQHYRFDHPRQHLSSGGLGTMGFGLPAAIGAQFAAPRGMVINISGDGSFMMNAQELATLVRYRLPVKLIILDNQCLGMVRQQQELFYANRESQIDLDDNPDFVALAEAFGIAARRIQCWQEVDAGLNALLTEPGPMLLHVAIAREDNVWPIVKPGESNQHMLDGASLAQPAQVAA